MRADSCRALGFLLATEEKKGATGAKDCGRAREGGGTAEARGAPPEACLQWDMRSLLEMPRAMRALMLAPVGLSLAVFAGCASSKSKDNTQLHKRLDELARREAENNRRIEDLNTRLFLLEDKLDRSSTQPNARGAREAEMEHLPIVRLKPRHIPSGSGTGGARRSMREGNAGDTPAEMAEADPSVGPPASIEPPRTGAEGAQSLVAAHPVEFGGPALHRGGRRPVLRLKGRAAERYAPSRDASNRYDDEELKRLGERIPVVPVASKKVAEALARAEPRATKDQVVAAYKKALVMYRERRLVDAVGAFRKLIETHPDHDYADNAMYWLAECFYDLKQYPAAAAAFERVVAKHPGGNKAPDALLKAGFSYLRMGKLPDGRERLRRVRQKYPDSRVAKLALETLSKLE
jgi:tol-pal system protein YbgF